MQQAHRDIDAVYSMGLFDDVKILPQPAEDSTLETPILDLTLQVKERKNGGFSGGVGISAQVIFGSLCFSFPQPSRCLPFACLFPSLLFAFCLPLLSLCSPFALRSQSFCFYLLLSDFSFPLPPHCCLQAAITVACLFVQPFSALCLAQALHTMYIMNTLQCMVCTVGSMADMQGACREYDQQYGAVGIERAAELHCTVLMSHQCCL